EPGEPLVGRSPEQVIGALLARDRLVIVVAAAEPRAVIVLVVALFPRGRRDAMPGIVIEEIAAVALGMDEHGRVTGKLLRQPCRSRPPFADDHQVRQPTLEAEIKHCGQSSYLGLIRSG